MKVYKPQVIETKRADLKHLQPHVIKHKTLVRLAVGVYTLFFISATIFGSLYYMSKITADSPSPDYENLKTFDTSASGASAIGVDSTVLSNGTVYAIGTCSGSVTFDGVGGSDTQDCVGQPDNTGQSDSYLTKYNPNGSYGWTKLFDPNTSGSAVNASGIASDNSGDVYITGTCISTVTFDGVGGSDNQDCGANSVFLTKYNADGSYGWTKTVLAGGVIFPSIAVDSSGDIFVSSNFCGSVTFDGAGGSNTQDGGSTCASGAWIFDKFLTKYNPDGSYAWTQLFGVGSNADDNLYGGIEQLDWGAQGNTIALDSSGNIYITGTCAGAVTFDGPSGSDTQDCIRGNTFITKYNADGSYGWTTLSGANGMDNGVYDEAITIDSSDNIYVTGTCTGSVTFDGVGGSDTQVCQGNNGTLFLTKYNPDGSYAWTHIAAHPYNNFASLYPEEYIKTDSSGDIYLSGQCTGQFTFNGSGGSDTQDCGGGYSGFLTKFNSDGSYAWTQRIGGSAYGIEADGDNVYLTGAFSYLGDQCIYTTSANSDMYLLEFTNATNTDFCITTTNLPDGTVGTSYSQQIDTADDTPEDFNISSGSLPPGLSIDPSTGIISGTPTTQGTFNFTVSATGTISSVVATSQTLSITIDPNLSYGDYNAISEIGQTDNSGNIDWTQNAVNNNQNSVVANGLNCPSDTVLDSTNHRLFVDDGCNSRTLIYQLNDQNQVTSQTPTYELGQGSPGTADFTDSTCNQGNSNPSQNSLCYPYGLAYDPTSNLLFVSDNNNSRILAFNVDPSTIQDGENATYELGQGSPGTADFTDSSCDQNFTTITANDLCYPAGLAYDSTNNQLYVTDQSNNRILAFNVDPSTIQDGENATHELGQGTPGTADFTDGTCNQGNSNSSQNSLCSPVSIAYDSTNNQLYVSDQSNNRILAFNVDPSTIQEGENATHELGQGTPGTADFTDNVCNQNAFPSQNSLCYPVNIAYDSANQNLFVADGNNNRILDFNANPSTLQDGENASGLIGRQNYTSTASCIASQTNLCGASGGDMAIDPTTNTLFVPDGGNNRIMVFEFADLAPSDSAPGGVVGTNYSFNASYYYQGTPTFSVTSGSLPTGTSLNSSTGVVSGSPTSTGSYTFTINLSDNNGQYATFSDTKTYTVDIISSGGGNNNSSSGSNSSTSTTSSSTTSSSSTTTSSSTPPTNTTPINLDNQTGYQNGSGYQTTSSPGQTYTFSAPTSPTNTVTVKQIIPPKTVVLTVNNHTITITTGQTIEQSVDANGQPDIKITLESINGGKATLVFTKIQLASMVLPTTHAKSSGKTTIRHKTLFTTLLLFFPWLLFVILGLISLTLAYGAYKERKINRKLHEQLKWETNLAEQKNNFITLSSHYFRTPLSIISGGIELATSNQPDEVKQDFNKIVDKLKQAVNYLVDTVTAPVTNDQTANKTFRPTAAAGASVTPLIADAPIAKPKAVSRHIIYSLVAAYGTVAVGDLILHNADVYNIEYINFMEEFAAIILVTIALFTAHRLYWQTRTMNSNIKNLVADQANLDESRNSLIKQSLVVLDEPLKQLKAKLDSLSKAQDSDKLLTPALNGISRFDSIMNKFTLITLLKSDANKPLVKEEVAIDQLVANLLPKYEETIKAKNLSIKTDFKVTSINQNRALLTAVVDTLISNAIKYSPEHQEVSITSSKQGDQVSLNVADKGVGLSDDKLSQIFEPFSRVEDASEDFNKEGMGLSLYIDKLIMDYLGGGIDLKTQGNQGVSAQLSLTKA